MDDKKMMLSNITEQYTVVRTSWENPLNHPHYYMLLGNYWLEIGSDDGHEVDPSACKRGLDDIFGEVDIVARPITG